MIYSPSKTEAYDACSLKGKLMYGDKYEPKEASNGTVGKITGAAFARGAQDIHKGDSDGVLSAGALFDRTVDHYVKYGVSFSTDMGKVKDELAKTLVKYAKDNPFKRWTVYGTEVQLTDYGRCRLDVVGIDPEGYHAIADNKYKRNLNMDYLNKTVNEYRDSWQFQHYPWAWNEWLKDGGDLICGTGDGKSGYQPARRMYLVLVAASPYKVLSYPFAINYNLQKRWIASAQQAWADISAIEKGDRQPRMAAKHSDNFGQCPMYKGCMELDLNEDLIAFHYVKVPRLPDDTI